MLRRRWAADTLSRWFAMNIMMALLVAAAMNAAFVQFAGVWAKPGIKDIGIVEQAAAVVRLIDSAPRDMRPRLARAARGDVYSVEWFPNDDALPMRRDDTYVGVTARLRDLIGRQNVRVLGSEPGDPGVDGTPTTKYALAIDLSDGSWLLFVAPERSWGLNPWARNVLTGIFALAGSVAVGALASRRLARPMEKFARQAQRFGADVNAPPMESAGPLEFRMAAHAFNDMQARVKRYVADRTYMLAAISHDLRAPLTRMRLRGEFVEDEEQQRRLFRDVDDMRAMVDSALAFFRDDSEQEEATRFNLSELVNTVVDNFRDAGSDVAFHHAGSVAYTGRPLSLRRTFSNLVENAVKYGTRAVVTMQETDDGIEVTIDDDGAGIPEKLHEAVFRPFYRIEASRNRQTGGVGLGLAAARSAVRGHGGDIVLENRAEGGLTVRVRLPVFDSVQALAACHPRA
ncbi:MAG: HAMP domain-containing sensor histidine kinase [Luteibacter jiangsuensis]